MSKKEESSKKAMNKKREIVIDKFILNISVGTSGDKSKQAKFLYDFSTIIFKHQKGLIL